MPLNFGAVASDRVEIPNSTSINLTSTFTILMWIYPTVANLSRRLLNKTNGGDVGEGWVISRGGATATEWNGFVNRTVDSVSTTADFTLNAWQLLGMTFDTNDAAQAIHLYRGTRTAALAETSYVGTPTAGSGAATDCAGKLIIGNRVAADLPFQGSIAFVGLWNRVLTLAQMKDQQFHMRPTSGNVIFTYIGFNGTGTQPDWSGNRNAGAVTGATVTMSGGPPLNLAYGADSDYATGLSTSSVIVGTATATSTFESISVVSPFTGDTNGVATCAIQYKATSSSTWIDAYTPMIDRRTVIEGLGGDLDNAANYKQARVSIVGLTAGTSYDIQCTWSSAEGVSGTNPATVTVSTLSKTPTVPGVTVRVPTDFANIGAAIAGTSAGDAIRLENGYSQAGLTISTAGSSGNYRKLYADPGDTATLTSALVMSADFWWIKNIAMSDTSGTAITISSGADHIYLDEILGGDVCTGGGSGAAIALAGTNNNIFILDCLFTCNELTTNAGPFIYGVLIDSGTTNHTIVVDGCTFNGNSTTQGFWDVIGGGSRDAMLNMTNCDFCHNTFNNWNDDGVELDGGGINVRFFDNTMETHVDTGNPGSGTPGVGISVAPVNVGPAYVFRNALILSGRLSYGTKYYDAAHNVIQTTVWFFHNTFDLSGAVAGGNGVLSYSRWAYLRNNLGETANGNMYDSAYATMDGDYNLFYSSGGSDYASNWDGTATDYTTRANFTTGTGNETNGKPVTILVDPGLSATLEITSSSTAYDTGVLLPNFNTRDSIWGYSDSAPDIGYFEVNGFFSGGGVGSLVSNDRFYLVKQL